MNPPNVPFTYKSTRGGESNLDFETVLFSTYAKDGGLFVPEIIPTFSHSDLYSWRDKSFPEICAIVMHMFSGIDLEELNGMTNRAYGGFNGGGQPLLMTPIGKEEERLILLDASLGPTLAFKDIGQQIVGQLLNYYVARSGKKANIMVRTLMMA
jgi:threonine synthase